MMEWLDNYIYDKNLVVDDIRYLSHYPLLMFSYKIAGCSDYKRVQGNLALLQKTYYKGAFLKEVSYIIDHTGLTKWQKLWLKFQYIFL